MSIIDVIVGDKMKVMYYGSYTWWETNTFGDDELIVSSSWCSGKPMSRCVGYYYSYNWAGNYSRSWSWSRE